MTSKLVVIGLDGVRLDVVKRFRDHLPVLDSMLSSGASGDLKSVLPGPHSGPAWTSFSTGLNPGKHGIGDWRVRDGYDFVPASGDDIDDARFWDYLSEAGYTAGIFNIPLTGPPEPLDGVVVTSWTNSLDRWAYPESFQHRLEKSGYRRKANFSDRNDPLTNLTDSIEARRRGFELFVDEYDFDLLVGMFYETEQAHHQFATMLDPDHPLHEPDDAEKVRHVYKKVDEELGVLRDRVDDDATFVVMSDHGFCPLYERVYLNRILEEYGYYTPASSEETDRSLSNQLLAGTIRRLKRSDAVRTGAEYAADLPVLGATVRRLIDRYRSVEYRKVLTAEWKETVAFNGYEHGGIFVNTVDNPGGNVAQDRRQDVVGDILADLRADQYLAKRVDGIYPREALFEGEKTTRLPDVIIDFADGYLGSSGYHDERSRGPEYFAREDKNVGFHTMNGLFIADGPTVRNTHVENASLLDIAPTVLQFLGTPIPENFDGEPLSRVFEPGSEFMTRDIGTRAPLTRDGGRKLTESEQQAVESRLREMGYR